MNDHDVTTNMPPIEKLDAEIERVAAIAEAYLPSDWKVMREQYLAALKLLRDMAEGVL